MAAYLIYRVVTVLHAVFRVGSIERIRIAGWHLTGSERGGQPVAVYCMLYVMWNELIPSV
jgi:hypothetical protein